MEPKSTDAVDTNLSHPKSVIAQSESLEIMSAVFENLSVEPSSRTIRISDIFAKSPEEESLTRNEAVLGDTEIPSTSTGLTSHLEPELETTNKIISDVWRSGDAGDDDSQVTPGPGDKLGEDELKMIFSNTWLSAQDLLNFRLVSKTWRDAATTSLRRRDACVVELRAKLDSNPSSVYKTNSKYTDEDGLSQLTELMSMSPKFPATNFRIYMSLMDFTPQTRFPDLLNFFKFHGDKIKTLRPYGRITGKLLLEILQIYAPTLESLDLSEAELLESDEGNGSARKALKWTSKAFSLKSLTLGSREYCNEQYEHEFFRLLLSSPSKLNCIENVTLATLQIVLTEGKGHFIRSFNYRVWDALQVPASQLTKFVSLNPKPQLSKVTFYLEDSWLSAAATIIISLNEFIDSFKDTVQTLELLCHYRQRAWDTLLNIPPMQSLKSLTLKLWTECGGQLIRFFLSSQAEESKIYIDVRGTLFQFQDGISAQNYFPSLMQVRVHSSLSEFIEVSHMGFFSFKSDTDNADGSATKSGFFPKVDVLEINRIDVGSIYRRAGTFHSPAETLLVADVFPNIRILKFICGEVSNLSSDLWTLCPNVEFMEISGILSCSSGGRGMGMSHFVDKIFTGFSHRMLRRLRRPAAGFSFKADDSEYLKFEPRISDLRRLRELKLKFVGKWSTQFASWVTGVHALSKMENTKFIISYVHDPEERESAFGEKVVASRNKVDENIDAANGSVKNGDDKIAKYEELIFGPLKPYVHILHETRTREIWDELH